MARIRLIHALTAIGALAAASLAIAQHDHHAQPPHAPHAASTHTDPYPLATCPVSGERLGEMGDPVVKQYDGREVRFCCKSCVSKFEADKDKYWKKIDDQIFKDQLKYYPLTTCVISGEPLVEDGEDIGVNYVYNNRLIRFCCRGCVRDFLKAPDAALAKLDEATAARQRPSYPLQNCPVSGEKLGEMGEPNDVVIGNRLIRLCCKHCEAKLRANPLDYLAKVDEAWKRQGLPKPAPGAPEKTDDDHDAH